MIDLALIAACAPTVAPTTIQAIIKVESSGNPLAVNVNKRAGVAYPLPTNFKSIREAVSGAKEAIKAGHTVDMGYMQVNSANLPKLGYTVEDMFDPCKNLAAGAKVLTMAYESVLHKHADEQAALLAALSIYNTGNSTRGFRNGYVSKYVGGAGVETVSVDPYTADTAIQVFQD